MAALEVTVAGAPGSEDHPHVALAGGTKNVVLPVTSATVELTNLARTWVETSRPMLPPLLGRGARQLSELPLEVVADADLGVDVERLILDLVELADGVDPVALAYAPVMASGAVSHQGAWRVTDLRVTTDRLEPGTNRVLAATIRVLLKECSDEVPPSVATPRRTSAAGGARRHTVTAGETLSSLAARYYGDPGAWHRIADASGITDPRAMRVGQVLVLP